MAARSPYCVQHALNHRVALIPGKIHVDVGRVLAARIQKAAEVEVVLDRADIGDAQAVGHQGGGPRAPAAGARAAGDDVAHDEKIGRKPHAVDDAQLVLQTVHHRFGQIAGRSVGGRRR